MTCLCPKCGIGYIVSGDVDKITETGKRNCPGWDGNPPMPWLCFECWKRRTPEEEAAEIDKQSMKRWFSRLSWFLGLTIAILVVQSVRNRDLLDAFMASNMLVLLYLNVTRD